MLGRRTAPRFRMEPRAGPDVSSLVGRVDPPARPAVSRASLHVDGQQGHARLHRDAGPARHGPTSQIVSITPASIGSEWFRNIIYGHAYVLALNPRLTFVGETAPYPKDLILSIFCPAWGPGFDVWRWRP